jgi:hypothetical protein
MREKSNLAGSGISVLDGVALVAGAAVASVHLMGLLRQTEPGEVWVLFWGAFAWVTLTATGPFLYVLRKYFRALDGYPKTGDRLWAMLGLPWVLTSALATSPGSAGLSVGNSAYAAVLSVALALVSVIAVAVVWGAWVMVTPGEANERFGAPWTNRVGLILSVAWPVQCGVGMIVVAG